MRVSSTPNSIALSGAAVSATVRPKGSATPPSASHCSAERALSSVSPVVKVFDAITSRVAAGSNSATAASSAAPSTLATIAAS